MFLVVGPGRSGTSSVARILHETGVFMGAEFVPANDSNPAGHFEDTDFRNLNRWRLDGDIAPEDWAHSVKRLASMRSEPWGFKDPRTAHFIDEYRGLLDPRFIRCRRPAGEVIASMCRWYGWPESEARNLTEFRESMLDHHLKGAQVLDITINDLRAGSAEVKIGEFTDA